MKVIIIVLLFLVGHGGHVLEFRTKILRVSDVIYLILHQRVFSNNINPVTDIILPNSKRKYFP